MLHSSHAKWPGDYCGPIKCRIDSWCRRFSDSPFVPGDGGGIIITIFRQVCSAHRSDFQGGPADQQMLSSTPTPPPLHTPKKRGSTYTTYLSNNFVNFCSGPTGSGCSSYRVYMKFYRSTKFLQMPVSFI